MEATIQNTIGSSIDPNSRFASRKPPKQVKNKFNKRLNQNSIQNVRKFEEMKTKGKSLEP